MAIRKIKRKWQRFEVSLAKEYAGNKALQHVLEKLNS
jgi:hypothetical protein